MVPQLFFEVALVRKLDVLRQVAEKSKDRRMHRKLGHIFDFDVFALDSWRSMPLDSLQQYFIKCCRSNFLSSMLIDF